MEARNQRKSAGYGLTPAARHTKGDPKRSEYLPVREGIRRGVWVKPLERTTEYQGKRAKTDGRGVQRDALSVLFSQRAGLPIWFHLGGRSPTVMNEDSPGRVAEEASP